MCTVRRKLRCRLETVARLCPEQWNWKESVAASVAGLGYELEPRIWVYVKTLSFPLR